MEQEGLRGPKLRVGRSSATLVRAWQRRLPQSLYVGLSGGIGAGKTEVAGAWEACGAAVFSADQLAREVVEPGSPALAEIRARFGTCVLNEDGTLDRAALARRVFADPAELAALERITHPRIADLAARRRTEAIAARVPVVVYDVPLLVEQGMAGKFDCIVMVDAPEVERLRRLEERGMEPADARRRLASQSGVEDRRSIANIWIENLGGRSELSELASTVCRDWLIPGV